MIYDVTLEQPLIRSRRATVRVEATDAHDAYEKAREQVTDDDWLTDPEEYLSEFIDVEAVNVGGGWTYSFRDETP